MAEQGKERVVIETLDGSLEKAREIILQGIAVEPDSPICRFFLVDVLTKLGEDDAAEQVANEIRGLDSSVSASGLILSYSNDKTIRDRFAANMAKYDLA